MSQRTVLVVEDEPDLRETIGDVLMDEGYAVELAENGQEALRLLPALRRPCAVILDITMPVMSGTELYAAMQADPRLTDIPVMVSTSDPSRAPSGVLIMRKPVNLRRMLSALAALF